MFYKPTHVIGAGDSIGTYHPKPSKQVSIKDTPLQPQTAVQSLPEPVAVSYTAPAPSGCVTGVTIGDYYTNLVMQRESGGNSCALNPSGACGLFQALPCSKMGCTLYDVACQEAWGEGYIAAVYGSGANAWAHELSFGWY